MYFVLKNFEKVFYDVKVIDEILKVFMFINWEKIYKDREELRKMFEKFIIKVN